MKKTICLWALLLIVVSCTNDDNYNDEHGDKAVIPPKGRIIRIRTTSPVIPPMQPIWTRWPR